MSANSKADMEHIHPHSLKTFAHAKINITSRLIKTLLVYLTRMRVTLYCYTVRSEYFYNDLLIAIHFHPVACKTEGNKK